MNVSPSGAGQVKVNDEIYTGSIRCAPNADVELEAVPATGYVFINWSGALDGNDNPATLSMTCSKAVTANFISENLVGTIGDFVWEDKDADGIQDSGEPGINGVVVNLYDAGDNLIKTTATAGGGFYSFIDLEPGNYYLIFTYSIGGYIFSPINQGSNDLVDSDIDFEGRTAIIALAYGQTDMKWDAGMYRPNSLSYSIPLSSGLNLVSLPLIPKETQPQVVLASLDFSIAAMYKKSEEAFKAYIKVFPPEVGFVWKDGLGYWFNMNGPGALAVTGSELPGDSTAPLSYDLSMGWNLIGFKSTTPRQPGNYLAGLDGKYRIIYGYGNGGFFIVGTEGHEFMEPGRGYWIDMTEKGTIYPPLEQIIENITVQQAYDMIHAVPAIPGLVILDVRTQTEYDSGHIENAAHLDYYSPTFTQDLNNLDKTGTYIVYCGSGGRSAKALNIMKDLGFREAYNMLGGTNAWTTAGFPVVN